MWPIQMANCSGIDRSSPRLARICAICSVVAASPASTAAGSPGVRRSIRNTSTATISSTGSVASSRRGEKVQHRLGAGRAAAGADQAPVLLQVPVDVAVGDEEAADVLARRHRLVVLAERRMGADLERARVDLVGQLLLRRLVGGAHELVAQLHQLVVAGPAEPAASSRRACPSSGWRSGSRRRSVCQAVRNMCQPPLSGAILLGAAADQRLPVHRLQVDLEAGLAQQLRGDVGQLLDRGQVGRLHQHDRRAVVARGLEQVLRLLHVGLRLHVAAGERCRRACRR